MLNHHVMGRVKKCDLAECICKGKDNEQMPITAICDPQNKQHPKNIHSKISPQREQEFLVHEHLDLPSLKRISRKYPNTYTHVKARKKVEAVRASH